MGLAQNPWKALGTHTEPMGWLGLERTWELLLFPAPA